MIIISVFTWAICLYCYKVLFDDYPLTEGAIVFWVAFFATRLIQAAFKHRDRFQWLREWPERRIAGWGFCGARTENEGYFYVEWTLRQIVWRIPRTSCTRAMDGGMGLGPARAWFYIVGDVSPQKSCFGIYFQPPFTSRWPGSRMKWWGRFNINYWPQNNVVMP